MSRGFKKIKSNQDEEDDPEGNSNKKSFNNSHDDRSIDASHDSLKNHYFDECQECQDSYGLIKGEPDVVISGISGRFPLSDDINEFKDNLYAGVDMMTCDSSRWPTGECSNYCDATIRCYLR